MPGAPRLGDAPSSCHAEIASGSAAEGTRTSQTSAALPFASASKVAKPSQPDASKSANDRPIMDVVAGAMARAASQSTVHPIDTLKVRMQAGRNQSAAASIPPSSVKVQKSMQLRQKLLEFASLYKGVLGAATGAGIIIGSYFAFYSNTKNLLRQHTDLKEGSLAFISGATAAVGSSVVKVPIAVCIRSVQAGVYPNAVNAAQSIVSAAGLQGLFTGFLPTVLEDVPDMAVKFTVYESLRAVHIRLRGEQPSTWEDLVMGGTAGAAAAAATTPLDVVKTRMMCSASSRPTITAAIKSVLDDGNNWKAFFRGVGPRALSNGLNSAIFFCFFEAIRRALLTHHQERKAQLRAPIGSSKLASISFRECARWRAVEDVKCLGSVSGSSLHKPRNHFCCLSLAIPLNHPGPS